MNASRFVGRLAFAGVTALISWLSPLTAAAADTNIITWGTGSVTNVPDLRTNAIAVTGGDTHGIALLADRTVQAWGSFLGAPVVVPLDTTNILGIAAGSSHQSAVRSDGTLALWGYVAGNGRSTVPADATNVMAVGVGPGAQHALVLRADGTVVDWGLSETANIPPEAFNVVSVAAGSRHSVALRSDGKVVAWGGNNYGEINVPASATNIVAIATTWRGNIALRADGRLLTWGINPNIPNQSTLTDIVEVAGSGYSGFSPGGGMALKGDGTVVAGGASAPAGATNIMAIGGSGSAYMAVKAAGPPIFPLPAVRRTVAATQTAYLRLRAVGALPLTYQWNFQGTNLPGATDAVLVVSNAVPSQSGFYLLVASNATGVVTNSDMELVVVPLIITNQPKDQAVYVGASPTLSVGVLGQSPSYQWSFNGTNIAWSTSSSLTLTNIQLTNGGAYSVSVSNSFGGLISSNAVVSVWPILVTQPPQDQVVFRGGTAAFNIAAQASSPLSYQWQFDGTDLPGATGSSLTLTNVLYEQAGPYSVIASTTNAVVTNAAVLSVVQIAAWGQNTYGQASVPANVTNVITLGSGGYFGLVVRDDGTLAAWGSSGYGQTSLPPDLTNVVTLGAGDAHSLAIREDGTLTAWGWNGYGQTNVPPGLTNVAVSAGGRGHTLTLTANGLVAAWGLNTYGQTNVPAELTNVVKIAAGYYHSLALRSDGTVVAWGRNNDGQTNVPPGLANVVEVAAGSDHSLALRADGTVVGWGSNANGQTNVPTGLANVVAIAAGLYHNLALKADGTVAAWGYNNYGQANVPTGLTNVVAIAAGYFHNYGLVGNGPPVVNGLPVNPVWANGVFGVSLVSQNNRVYRLEHKDELPDAAWVAHPLVAGTGGTLTFTDPTATGTQRFYRVRRW